MSTVVSERYNASLLVERNVEAGRGDKPAYLAPDATLTYDGLRRAGQPRRAPAARAGRPPRGPRADGPRRHHGLPASLFLGAMRIGAVPVPVSPLDRLDNYRHYAEDSYATHRGHRRRPAAAPARGARRARRALPRPRRRRQRRRRARRRARRPERRARPGADAPRRHGLLALQLGLDRQAQGRRAPPARHRGDVRDLRAPGARPARGRRRRSRRPSSSTPTGWATASRSRCGSARRRSS